MYCRGSSRFTAICLLAADEALEVVLDAVDVGRAEAELGGEDAAELGADKGGHVGAEDNVLDAEVEEGEEDGDGLLLKPGDGKGEGQRVDVGVEGLGQLRGDDDGAVGVVALAHVQDAGQAGVGHGAKVQLVEAVLAAAERQDDRRVGRAGGQLLVVVALALAAVAAADDEEAGDVALLDGLDDLVCDAEDGLVAKADGDGVGLGLLHVLARDEALHGLGLGDDLGEVALAGGLRDVGDARPADGVEGVDVVLVALARLDDAVGGHDDGAGELGKLKLLQLPGAAVVADEVLELLERRVAVGRQHLAVGVDVDAGALGLLQELVQVVHVVAADQDALARHGRRQDLGRRRVAKLGAVAGVQHGEHLQVGGTHLQRRAQQRVKVLAVLAMLAEQRQRRVHVAVHVGRLLAERRRVRRIGGHALQAVGDELLQAGNLLALDVAAGEHAAGLALLDEPVLVVAVQLKLRRLVDQLLGLLAGSLAGSDVLLAQVVAVLDGLRDELVGEAVGVKVDVGQGGEEGVDGELVGLGVLRNASLAGLGRPEAEALEVVDEEVLQGSDLRGLAAYADDGAALALVGLLALHAEHVGGSLRARSGGKGAHSEGAAGGERQRLAGQHQTTESHCSR
eukprot:m.57274 g.57274  ORF g.57274 m.57274 type:complete len:624 (-) comp13447_c0_seq2:122-1993(-)